jgi:hypothetical protein
MAFKEKEDTKAGQDGGTLRGLREKRDRQEAETWTRDDFHHDLALASATISDDLDANPRDAARLQKSRTQVQQGEVRWGVEDSDESKNENDAGA